MKIIELILMVGVAGVLAVLGCSYASFRMIFKMAGVDAASLDCQEE